MDRYRKKPVEVEAVQYDGENVNRVIGWIIENGGEVRYAPGGLFIRTLEGEMRAFDGDFVIRGVAGEFYPCKPDIFASSYDRVEG